MRPAKVLQRILCPLLTLGVTSCSEPAPGTPGPIAMDPAAQAPDPADELAVLSMPSELPATVYTRIAPVSIVDERGVPLQVLTGDHTRLELAQVLRERALVSCQLCPNPVEGWIQVSRLMPAGYLPAPAELADEKLALALFAAQLRRELESGAEVDGLELDRAQRETLMRVVDQGFLRQEREAIAPASGGAYAREGSSVRLRFGPEGWYVKKVELQEP